jgi:hypothetical protein
MNRQGKAAEALKDFEKCLKLNRELRLMIDLHIMELEMQIREMQRRRVATQDRII